MRCEHASELVVALLVPVRGNASDHLDTPTVTADPAADIGDLFAWTSADWAGELDYARGDASRTEGLEGHDRATIRSSTTSKGAQA